MKREAIEAAMRMRLGPSPERRETLRAHNEAQKDWRGRCTRCGKEITGTLADLRAHGVVCPHGE